MEPDLIRDLLQRIHYLLGCIPDDEKASREFHLYFVPFGWDHNSRRSLSQKRFLRSGRKYRWHTSGHVSLCAVAVGESNPSSLRQVARSSTIPNVKSVTTYRPGSRPYIRS